MLLANQRLRERGYEERDCSEPASAEESASAIRGVSGAGSSKPQREPTLLGVSARERRTRDATLVGVGNASSTSAPSAHTGEEPAEREASPGKSDSSTDATIPRIEQTFDVSLGEMEVLRAQDGASVADSTGQLPSQHQELSDDTQGEWIRFEKSFANVTITAILCAILAFFLLPSGHDAPVPPPAAKEAKQGRAAAASVAGPGDTAQPIPSEGATNTTKPTLGSATSPPQKTEITSSPGNDVRPKRRARTAEERKALRKKRREARATRDRLTNRAAPAQREVRETRRKTSLDSANKRARSGGKS